MQDAGVLGLVAGCEDVQHDRGSAVDDREALGHVTDDGPRPLVGARRTPDRDRRQVQRDPQSSSRLTADRCKRVRRDHGPPVRRAQRMRQVGPRTRTDVEHDAGRGGVRDDRGERPLDGRVVPAPQEPQPRVDHLGGVRRECPTLRGQERQVPLLRLVEPVTVRAADLAAVDATEGLGAHGAGEHRQQVVTHRPSVRASVA
nr:hypothetical protein N8D75_01875 [Curtobacterium flaccumfaciens]